MKKWCLFTTAFLLSLFLLSCDNIFYDSKSYTVTGSTLLNGGSYSGVMMTLSGTARRKTRVVSSVKSNGEGVYAFSDIPNGAYTIRPEKEGYYFSPESRVVEVYSGNLSIRDFKVIPNSISGTILLNDAAFSRVPVTLTGEGISQEAISNSDGAYTFSVLPAGTYTISPSQTGYHFTPGTINVDFETGSLSIADIKGIENSFSGSVLLNGSGLDGVSLTISGTEKTETVLTASDGSYLFGTIPNGTYTITVSKTGYHFSPASFSVTMNSSVCSNPGILAVENSVSGKIVNPGYYLPGVTVTLSGNGISQTAESGTGGVYSFAPVPDGTYTITPSSNGFNFTPESRTVSVCGNNPANYNFSYIRVWSKTFGCTKDDKANYIQQTVDGGYIVSSWTRPGNNADAWGIKLSKSGSTEWSQTYGGVATDHFEVIKQTPDGGYIAAGDTGAVVIKNLSVLSVPDFYVVKLSSSGVPVWEKNFGGSDDDEAKAMDVTLDGGCIVAGYTDSYGSGGSDFWVLKLDSSGNKDWEEFFGGTGSDSPRSIQQTSDGGYIVGGNTWSYGSGIDDMWILKLDSSGQLEWQYLYGGVQSEKLWSIQETADGYIAAGHTHSYNLDGSISSGAYSNGVILKLSSAGTKEWIKFYGGSGSDEIHSVSLTDDGGYVATGSYTVSGNGMDLWILKLDSLGDTQWERKHGDTGSDRGYSIVQTSDGGYAVAGYTSSYGNGGDDCWMLKLDTEGNYQ
ncbi:MAG: carboxypeptidase regulatory-like domain-containing protein [bacterium]|nr:carboxypeptidase regulatory-like domain-containing protein [bacterium]